MTKTYMIHAWCSRPFISWLEMEAATPEEAAAKARVKDADLLDAAEECNSGYPWAEFTVYDKSGRQLLHILDGDARLREAAPTMLCALEEVTPLLDACARNAERLGQREFAAMLLTIMSANRRVIAKATVPTTTNDQN